jgi:hypothetical protein
MVTIEMSYADSNAQSYGIMFESKYVHTVKGSRNREYPHRIKIWANMFRKNPHPGEIRYTDFGSIGGEGKYLDPQNRGTDEPVSVLMSAEAIVITNSGSNTGTIASGQVYGEDLAMGDTVTLKLPNGTIHGPYVIEARPLHDPHLTPVE